MKNSKSDNDVICTGGDNSYGLIITELDGEQQQISVNDSIIGRGSNPFIAKVGIFFYLNLEEIKCKHLVTITETLAIPCTYQVNASSDSTMTAVRINDKTD